MNLRVLHLFVCICEHFFFSLPLDEFYLIAIKTSTKTFALSPIIIFKFASFEQVFFSATHVRLVQVSCVAANKVFFALFIPHRLPLLIDKHCDLETINFEGFRVCFNSFFFSFLFLSHNLWVIRHVNLFCARPPVDEWKKKHHHTNGKMLTQVWSSTICCFYFFFSSSLLASTLP